VLEVLFWTSTLLVVYSYVGYLVLSWRTVPPAPAVARRAIRPPAVLVVVHNEADRIRPRIENCLDLTTGRPAEVLVASGGSTDSTDEVVARYASRGVRLLRLPGPRGKASALNAAVPECRGEIVVLADARQRFAREAVCELVENFADPAVGAVSGELHIETTPGSPEGGPYWRYEADPQREGRAVRWGATGDLRDPALFPTAAARPS
jgi:cellulose synthase/poly-beta-1,6-N-acetylglucosamine synthase-like glycosyltransferase